MDELLDAVYILMKNEDIKQVYNLTGNLMTGSFVPDNLFKSLIV